MKKTVHPTTTRMISTSKAHPRSLPRPNTDTTTTAIPSPLLSSPSVTSVHQRGLTDEEIRNIFEVLYQATNSGNTNAKSSLPIPFQIVPCGPQCEKLSPPPYAFPNGLYVLLRPSPISNVICDGPKYGRCKHRTPSKSSTSVNTVEGTTHSKKRDYDSAETKSQPQIPAHLHPYPIWTSTTMSSDRSDAANVTPDTGLHTAATTTTTAISSSSSLSSIDCKWRLSGPQFPPPTAIQQRYCYPIPTVTSNASSTAATVNIDIDPITAASSAAMMATSKYCDSTGGALYTMYSATTGKELLDYRLLHVYYSSKRAGNKGVVSQRQSPSNSTTVSGYTTPFVRTIQSSPSLTMLPWPSSRKSDCGDVTSKKKVKRQYAMMPAKNTFQSPKTTSSNKRIKASLTPTLLLSSPLPQRRKQWPSRRNDNFHNDTTTTVTQPYYSQYVSMNGYHSYYDNYFDDYIKEPSVGQVFADSFQNHQQRQFSNYNISYGQDTVVNDYECGHVRRCRSDGGSSVYIPSSPTDASSTIKIGMMAETPRMDHTTAVCTDTTNNHDWSNYYNKYSQSPSPFRCPIRTARPPINIRNISPLFSTGMNVTKALDELDQYSELSLTHSPSVSSTSSSTSLLQQQICILPHLSRCTSHFDDIDNDVDDRVSAKPIAMRP